MNDVKIAPITGVFGIACVALTFGQFPLWLVGSPPSVYDGRGFAQHLFAIKNVAFTRILMDQGIYVSMLVFAAGLRHLIRQARAASEWIGTLLFGAALGWVAVTVVADGLEGGAVLSTLNSNPEPSACAASVPAMSAGPVDYTGLYNAGGWGPAIVANFPPMIWFLVVSVILIRRGDLESQVIVRAA